LAKIWQKYVKNLAKWLAKTAKNCQKSLNIELHLYEKKFAWNIYFKDFPQNVSK
jgi:hypothetical protein